MQARKEDPDFSRKWISSYEMKQLWEHNSKKPAALLFHRVSSSSSLVDYCSKMDKSMSSFLSAGEEVELIVSAICMAAQIS